METHLKKISTYLLDQGLFDITAVEQQILDNRNIGGRDEVKSDDGIFNADSPAPDIVGLENWINSDGYTSLTELRGKVVLIDFWTYSCINCIRTLPHIRELHEKYADDGLIIIGIHAPEFAFEHKIKNVKNAALEYGLTYPIVQDNNFETWRSFENHYWPAKYLIDKDGQLRYYHFGEGAYDKTERAITALLGLEMKKSDVEIENREKDVQTAETYLGSKRAENFAGFDNQNLEINQWTVSKNWEQGYESISSSDLPATLEMQFHAAEANLVLDGNATAEIFIDGVIYKSITINGPKLYNVFKENDYKDHSIKIEFSKAHVEAFAWTFG